MKTLDLGQAYLAAFPHLRWKTKKKKKMQFTVLRNNITSIQTARYEVNLVSIPKASSHTLVPYGAENHSCLL